MRRFILSFFGVMIVGTAIAQNSTSLRDDIRRFPEGERPDCRAIVDNMSRLSCWDKSALEHRNMEEINLLELFEFDSAANTCRFKVDVDQLNFFMIRNGLTIDDAYTKPRSENLQKMIDESANRFDKDPNKACADAWEQYGPNGSTAFRVFKGR